MEIRAGKRQSGISTWLVTTACENALRHPNSRHYLLYPQVSMRNSRIPDVMHLACDHFGGKCMSTSGTLFKFANGSTLKMLYLSLLFIDEIQRNCELALVDEDSALEVLGRSRAVVYADSIEQQYGTYYGCEDVLQWIDDMYCGATFDDATQQLILKQDFMEFRRENGLNDSNNFSNVLSRLGWVAYGMCCTDGQGLVSFGDTANGCCTASCRKSNAFSKCVSVGGNLFVTKECPCYTDLLVRKWNGGNGTGGANII